MCEDEHLALLYGGLDNDVSGRCRYFFHVGVIDGWVHQKGDAVLAKLLCDGKGCCWPASVAVEGTFAINLGT